MSISADRSMSCKRLISRLGTTRAHMLFVDRALSEITQRQGPDQAMSKHASIKNIEQTLQTLYTHLIEYLRSIISEMYGKKPLEIINKASLSMTYVDIVKLGSYEAVRSQMINQVFRSLEDQKSMKTTIKKILGNTGVFISPDILEDSMFYMEIRHLIVHNSSRMDDKFEAAYSGKVKYAKSGNRFPMTTRLAERAMSSVQNLAEIIDGGLISKGYVDPHTDLLLETIVPT